MDRKTVDKLLKLADSLDKRGLKQEADMVDGLIKRLAMPFYLTKAKPPRQPEYDNLLDQLTGARTAILGRVVKTETWNRTKPLDEMEQIMVDKIDRLHREVVALQKQGQPIPKEKKNQCNAIISEAHKYVKSQGSELPSWVTPAPVTVTTLDPSKVKEN